MIGVMPLPPAIASTWRGAVAAGSAKSPDGPSTPSVMPAAARSHRNVDIRPPATRFTVIVARLRSRASPDAEYARRTRSPSIVASIVKNCPGVNASSAPLGSRSVSDTASAVSRATVSTTTIRTATPRPATARRSIRFTSGGGVRPASPRISIVTSRRSCSSMVRSMPPRACQCQVTLDDGGGDRILGRITQ
jgi:hypothetical protein